MKNIILLYLLIMLFSSGCSSNNNDKKNHIIVHYSFDANEHNNFKKEAHIDGAVLTSDRFGNKNSAYYFDGKHSSIWIDLKNFPTYSEIQTISWWYLSEGDVINNNSFDAENMVVLMDTLKKTGIQFGFRARSYNTLGLDAWHKGGSTILEVKPPLKEKWHHCVYTFDGKINRFYLDGKACASSEVKCQDGAPTQLMFGNYPTGKQYFKGKIDDIRIYYNALDSNSISTLCKEVQK